MSLGDRVFINYDARIECVDRKGEQNFNPQLILDDGVSIEQRCHITVADTLVIGKFTTILSDVMITDIDHEYLDLTLPIREQPLLVRKTSIGPNCFIGSGARIQAGTILGNNCIVGANAVVRGIYPNGCVIVGVPGRILKIYDQDLKMWKSIENSAR